MKTISFMDYDCEIVIERFQFDQSICLNLIAADTQKNLSNDVFHGEPISRLSVCLPGCLVGANQTLIRVTDETKGALETLIDAGVVSKPLAFYDMGFVQNGAALVNVLIEQ